MTRFCGSPEHSLSRRTFLGTVAAGVASLANADAIKAKNKSVILLWLAGGSSQLETWDPKPGTPTGGPFRAIPTNVPGLHISELMPKMARRMQNTCVIRSLNTKNGDHGGATKLLMRGRRDEGSLKYPDLGAVVAKELGRPDSPVPDYVSFYAQTEGRDFGGSGFLGPRYAPMELAKSNIPDNLRRPGDVNDVDHRDRADLRDLLSQQFTAGRSGSGLGSHGEAYQRVRGLMASEELFDAAKEPAKVRERYGPTHFGEQTLVARRLIEAGVPFVRVARAWWDSHGQNFETHQEMVPELDHVMSTLLDDLSERSLLETTLVVTLAEFGRTPQINASLGRDHFASAWSCTLSGCGIKGGSVYGKTDAAGMRVTDGETNVATLFATIYSALGIDPAKEYQVGPRPISLTDIGTQPIDEVLA